jgi:hypothetical protein
LENGKSVEGGGTAVWRVVFVFGEETESTQSPQRKSTEGAEKCGLAEKTSATWKNAERENPAL